MKFSRTALDGVWTIDPVKAEDTRGYSLRTFSADEFAAHGLETGFVQCLESGNAGRGTLRGLHYQLPPRAEAKLVRCVSGAAFDVVVDIRPASATFRHWISVDLSATTGRMVYIPAGLAHGYQTLTDDTAIFYQISAVHMPELARGIRWDDPALGIAWPLRGYAILSERDRALPTLADALS